MVWRSGIVGVEGARCLRSDRSGDGVAAVGGRCWATHSQGGWIWQLHSIVHHLTESVPRTRRDDPYKLAELGRLLPCSPHTQG